MEGRKDIFYGRSTRTVTNLHQGELNKKEKKKGMKTNDKKESSVTQVRGTNNTINYFFQVRQLGIPGYGVAVGDMSQLFLICCSTA